MAIGLYEKSLNSVECGGKLKDIASYGASVGIYIVVDSQPWTRLPAFA